MGSARASRIFKRAGMGSAVWKELYKNKECIPARGRGLGNHNRVSASGWAAERKRGTVEGYGAYVWPVLRRIVHPYFRTWDRRRVCEMDGSSGHQRIDHPGASDTGDCGPDDDQGEKRRLWRDQDLLCRKSV